MCPQRHGSVLNHRSSGITYSMNMKYVLVFRKFNLDLMTNADHSCSFHIAVVCLQRRTEGHGGFRRESSVCSFVRKI